MDAPNTERLTLTVEEACHIIGIGRTAGYELARRGELPGVLRLGRTFRVSRPTLERALGIERAPTPTNAPEPEVA